MAVRSGFFQSLGGDRVYRSEFFASYFSSFIGNGVFPNPSSNLQVTANTGLQISVQPGKGWINGYYLINDAPINLTLTQADGVLSRIDRVIFSLNFTTREMEISVKQGTPSGNPVAPTLIRNTGLYELALADIRLNAGTTSVTAANITDTRLNAQLCGIVSGLINQVDTTTLFVQYQQQFDDFLVSIENALSGDVAGNLLNMINALDARLTAHEALPASTTQFGHVMLNDTLVSTSVSQAATANAVRRAYNRAEEAFQFGDSVKNDVVAALLSIQDNLPINNNSTWVEIEAAIRQISPGKRIAIGTANLVNNAAAPGSKVISVNGLDLTPEIIIGRRSGSNFESFHGTTLIRPFSMFVNPSGQAAIYSIDQLGFQPGSFQITFVGAIANNFTNGLYDYVVLGEAIN